MKITLEKAIELLSNSTAVIVNDYEVLFPDVSNDEDDEAFFRLEDIGNFLSEDNQAIEFDNYSSCLNLISSEGNEYQIQLLQVGHKHFE